MNDTTRETTRTGDQGQNFHEVESASISSVEVGEDAKGTRYVKSVKCYASDPSVAAKLTVTAFQEARNRLSALVTNEG